MDFWKVESENKIYVEKEEVKSTIREALCTICKTFPREYTCMACEVGDLIDSIEDLPFLRYSDVQPVKHGRWENTEQFIPIKCSLCGEIYGRYDAIKFKFCPNCGARMDGDKSG